ncbi:MAG: cytochrome c [Chloroflexi bacterium]|nr:cytochrome c [Chloroflexota bacterium]
MIRRTAIFLLILLLPLVVGLLFTYEVINVEFGSLMEDQISVKSQEGPPIPFPEGSVPYKGGAYVARTLTNPYPGDPMSVSRGEELFAIHCALCHGDKGIGGGPVGAYFDPPPPELTPDLLRSRNDAFLFQVLTDGFGRMPRMVENLSVEQRWDVINYLRSLAQE